MRSKLILKGIVQEVCFRAFVKQLALQRNIKGSVKNMDDSTVEIYCEYKDLEHLNIFIESLKKVSTDSGLKVESIERFDEGSEQYGNMDEKIFNTFSVYYGEKLSSYEIDQAERSEFTVFYGMQMFSSMNSDFDKLGEKIESGNNTLGDKIDSMHEDMNKRFDTLDQKYGMIAEALTRFLAQMEEHNKRLDAVIELLSKKKK